MPIPRRYFPAKPDALARIAVHEANADRKRGADFNIGPGLMGHIAADNPYLALPIYAIFGGLFLAFLDRLILRHPSNPFVVLPVGTTLGQVVGLARGETGLFLFNAVGGILAAWVGMYLAARMMTAMGWKIQADDEDEDFSEDGIYEQWETESDAWNEDCSYGSTYATNDWSDYDASAY